VGRFDGALDAVAADTTLVLHGADDVMCDVSGGRATAAAIPGAGLVIIDGMGHSLPAFGEGRYMVWCRREDSNLHGLPHQILNLARLPFRHADAM
jgi:hypothetical protein